MVLLYKKCSLDNNFRGKAGDYNMKKISFVFLLIFSLSIISGKEYKCEIKNDLFNTVEEYVLDKYQFVENGIKLEYTIEHNIEDELKRINNLLRDKSDFIVSKNKNCITAKGKDIKYNISIFDYNEILKIEIVIINNNEDILLDDLRGLAKEILNNNFLDKRYFYFVKSKLNEFNNDVIKDVKSNLPIEIIESLNITNGVIANATIKGKEDINIGQINYDTGSYLVIGTPIIFITY